MISDQKASCELHRLGLTPYDEALELQLLLHRECLAERIEGALIALEHPNVLTFGKNSNLANLLISEDELKARKIALFHVERGGEITAHMPGQLVAYPILPLRRWGFTPKKYVQFLESLVIDLLSGYGIEARTDPVHPGVWVKQEKICAIGIRIKDRVTMHGIALNIENSFDIFDLIIPCGIKGRGITSVAKLCRKAIVLDEISTIFIDLFKNKLDINWN